MNNEQALELLQNWDYLLTKTSTGHYRLVEGHGELTVNCESLEFAIWAALNHFLHHSLGTWYVEVWQALSRRSRKKIFNGACEDIDKALEWVAAYNEKRRKELEIPPTLTQEEINDLPF